MLPGFVGARGLCLRDGGSLWVSYGPLMVPLAPGVVFSALG